MTPDPAPPPSSFAPPFPALVAQGGAPLYLTGEESLKGTVFNAGAGVTVTITGRTLAFGDTRPSPFKQTFTPATDRSASTSFVGLPPGWLLNAQIVVSAGSPFTGQTFARLSLVHGQSSIADELATLCADYITAKQPLSYPGSGVLDATDGAGALRSITGSVPAAGAEISETVPTGARWELISFEADLVTSAVAGNRQPRLILDDGTNTFYQVADNINEVASNTYRNIWAQGMTTGLAAIFNVVREAIPVGIRLGAGFRIRTLTTAIDVGDQYASPKYLVREWIEGN